jgi:hypothetical protein
MRCARADIGQQSLSIPLIRRSVDHVILPSKAAA